MSVCVGAIAILAQGWASTRWRASVRGHCYGLAIRLKTTQTVAGRNPGWPAAWAGQWGPRRAAARNRGQNWTREVTPSSEITETEEAGLQSAHGHWAEAGRDRRGRWSNGCCRGAGGRGPLGRGFGPRLGMGPWRGSGPVRFPHPGTPPRPPPPGRGPWGWPLARRSAQPQKKAGNEPVKVEINKMHFLGALVKEQAALTKEQAVQENNM